MLHEQEAITFQPEIPQTQIALLRNLRRFLIQALKLGCLSFVLCLVLFTSEQTVAQANPYIRENIAYFMQDSEKLAALRKGIQVMQERSKSDLTDPTGWIYQANIHGVPPKDCPSGKQDPTTRACPPGDNAPSVWGTCQHGSYFFLPWHRMYLYYFERILRKASGDPTLALPYWNYSEQPRKPVPSSFDPLQLPLPFREPKDPSNSLYVSQRNSDMNAGGKLPPTTVSYSEAFQQKDFVSPQGSNNSFGGQQLPKPQHLTSPHGKLERLPHDDVHVKVGQPNGWMINPDYAARDPIFWLHHANIDRLWERWLDLNKGRTNPDPVKYKDWMQQEFTFFDENGKQVELTGAQILDTVKDLDYIYDDDPSLPRILAATEPAREKPFSEPVKESAKSMELSGTRSDISIPFNEPRDGQEFRAAALKQQPLILHIQGIEYDPSSYISYSIYINLPEGTEPDPNSIFYVGELALFAFPQGGEVTFDITDEVSQLLERNLIGEDGIKVTFVPSGPLPPEGMPVRSAAPPTHNPIRFQGVSISRE